MGKENRVIQGACAVHINQGGKKQHVVFGKHESVSTRWEGGEGRGCERDKSRAVFVSSDFHPKESEICL